MEIEWPLQNTVGFAVPVCVQCCNLPEPSEPMVYARSRGQMLIIIGISAYSGTGYYDGIASPRRWTLLTQSGAFHQDVYDPSYDGEGNVITMCGSVKGSFDVSYSGTMHYAPSPLSDSGSYPVITDTRSTVGWASHVEPGVIDSRAISESLTEDIYLRDGTGDCVYPWQDTPPDAVVTTGQATIKLTGEYLDSDAIAHFQSLAPWGDWYLGNAYARHQSRQCDPNDIFGQKSPYFFYDEGEWRVVKTDAVPFKKYSCKVPAYRAPVFSGDYVHYADLEVEATSDAVGKVVFEGQVPNEEGYETSVTNPPVISQK